MIHYYYYGQSWGGGIGVASDVQTPHFLSGADLGNPWMDFFNFAHTHLLGGVEVPF